MRLHPEFVPVPFQAHIQRLQAFLTRREEIVASLEGILNAQSKPARHLQGQRPLSQQFEDCFGEVHLTRQLEEAHWARGFRPRQVHHVYNDLIDPAELMARGVHCWQLTRWPGRSGRMQYAHALFNLYVLRCLQFLSMRLWDDEPGSAGTRLAEIQDVLDQLWQSSSLHQPAFVRDARWLIPLAQSLITDELEPYFEVARHVTETLPEADALAIQKAQVRMLGGHLASQIRYYCTRDGVSINDPNIVVGTRTANALDLALLVQGLVALLQAYERSGDERTRLDLAGAIFQGISPDPELFLNRVGLLSAYTMIEHVFIVTDHYSPLGERHVQLLKEYGALIARLIQPLCDDLPRFRPVEGGYSPYGVLFGLPTNLIEHMALKALQRDAETQFSLEDVFDDADRSAAKLAWVNGWRQLPHISREVQQLYDYPQQFAEDIYNRIAGELSARNTPRTGYLHIASAVSAIPDVPARYFASSDRPQLLRDRQEGHFLVSYETAGGWIALKKDLLTEVLGAGHDARITGLPRNAAQVLQLTCTDLVIPEKEANQASAPTSIEES